jgi:hypothetical protein
MAPGSLIAIMHPGNYFAEVNMASTHKNTLQSSGLVLRSQHNIGNVRYEGHKGRRFMPDILTLFEKVEDLELPVVGPEDLDVSIEPVQNAMKSFGQRYGNFLDARYQLWISVFRLYGFLTTKCKSIMNYFVLIFNRLNEVDHYRRKIQSESRHRSKDDSSVDLS